MEMHVGQVVIRCAWQCSGKHLERKARTCRHTHARSASRQQQRGWMEPQGLWSIIHTHTHTCKLSLLPLSLRFLLFAHSRVPLSSHHSLYSKLPSSFPLSFPLLLCPNTLRHLFSHSIMLLLDAFPPPSLSFNHKHFPCTLFSFFPTYFSTIVPSQLASHHSHSQFPSSFLPSLLSFFLSFYPPVAPSLSRCGLLPISLAQT